MSERRIALRSRTLWKGTILFPGGLRSIGCTVRNFSETGTKLDIGAIDDVPDHFALDIPQKGKTYNCKVAWRAGNQIGAHFVINSPGIAADAIAEKLRDLELQNKKLRKKLQPVVESD